MYMYQYGYIVCMTVLKYELYMYVDNECRAWIDTIELGPNTPTNDFRWNIYV